MHGADARNTNQLLNAIRMSTGWRDVDVEWRVYCLGTQLADSHLFRVNRAACVGVPLVIVAPGHEYDRERWAEVAEKPKKSRGGGARGRGRCVVS